MITSGMCSISFRKLSCDDLINFSIETGLKAIEWGGDVHCPHGNIAVANELSTKCRDKNITCPSYGSYYRVGIAESPDFKDVAASAQALGADTIRVWAGNLSPAKADEQTWQKVCADSRRISAIAADYGCRIAFEYHGGTLTENRESTAKLIQMLPEGNILFYWQPPHGDSVDSCVEGINEVLPRLSNLHVFYWGVQGGSEKYMLEEGRARWEKYFAAANCAKGSRYAFLEFAKDDNIENMRKDAAVLNDILDKL